VAVKNSIAVVVTEWPFSRNSSDWAVMKVTFGAFPAALPDTTAKIAHFVMGVTFSAGGGVSHLALLPNEWRQGL
jgi:hypothetical protein